MTARSTGIAKANATKAEKWARICGNPEAERIMRDMLDLEEEKHHARVHLEPRVWVCHNRPCALDMHSERELECYYDSRDLLWWELRHQFSTRFGVSTGYIQRFRSRMFYQVCTERHSQEKADTFTSEHRAALAEWLKAEAGAS